MDAVSCIVPRQKNSRPNVFFNTSNFVFVFSRSRSSCSQYEAGALQRALTFSSPPHIPRVPSAFNLVVEISRY